MKDFVTILLCYSIFILYILFLFETEIYMKIRKKIKQNYKILYLFLFLIFFVVLLLYIGYVYISPISINGDFLSYSGAIIGGALTLVGVWWTIGNQEKQRREDLAIQYKPYLSLSFDCIKNVKIEELYNIDNKKSIDSSFNSLIAIGNNCDLKEDCFFITFDIENKGDGECCLSCVGDVKLEPNFGDFKILSKCLKFFILPLKSFKLSDTLKYYYIQNGYTTSIYKKSKHKLEIALLSTEDSPMICDLTIIIPLNYTDQFEYKEYIADIEIIMRINMVNKDEKIKIISYGILNDLLTSNKNCLNTKMYEK